MAKKDEGKETRWPLPASVAAQPKRLHIMVEQEKKNMSKVHLPNEMTSGKKRCLLLTRKTR